MKKTFKLGELSQIDQVLNELEKERLPFPTMFKLHKIRKAVREEVADAARIRHKIINEYADHDENGDVVHVKEDNERMRISMSAENEKACLKEIEDLLNTEVEITYPVIKQSDFSKEVMVSGLVMDALYEFM